MKEADSVATYSAPSRGNYTTQDVQNLVIRAVLMTLER